MVDLNRRRDTGQTAGDFTVQQIREMAARLNAGASKLEVEIVD
jgi:preprotein translocase subunit SecD